MRAESLSSSALAEAVSELAGRDSDLRRVVERFGNPPLWDRRAGFPTLVHIVLEQQVSLASAAASFQRLRSVASPLTPSRFLELGGAELLAIGFSRQKARYVRLLAEAILDGRLDLDALHDLEDGAAFEVLVSQTGIGPWTATIYQLMVLLRPDVWPAADRALAAALHEVKALDHRPTADEMVVLGEPWRPWRAVAARVLWHHYLSTRGSHTPAPRRSATPELGPSFKFSVRPEV